MGCCHLYAPVEGGDLAFTIDVNRLTFGRGVLAEIGARARARGLRRVALLTDKTLAGLEPVARALSSLERAGVGVAVYDETRIEPSEESVMEAARFLREGGFDGYLSVGGGSVIDTCKAASLYATYPADGLTYAAPPNGAGKPVPGPLKPHIACPTTAGTGSECTPLAVVYFPAIGTKIPLLSRHILPTEALVDPSCTYSLPAGIVASSGFDTLSHALEGYTARRHTQRPRPEDPAQRPPIQGANPFSDLCCREALRLAGAYLERAVADASDHEARDHMAWAATLAGIGFGNTGTHAPHAMGYPVSALNPGFAVDAYPTRPMVPHGIGVIVNSPAVFRFTAAAAPQRHLEAAECLSADRRGVAAEDAGELIAGRIIALMKATGMPNGVGGIGYGADDVPSLAGLCLRQKRALMNAPRDIGDDDLIALYRGALAYW